MILNLQAVEYSTVFLDKSWEWFQDEELRILTQTPEFTKAAQRLWFESLPLKKDYRIWGIVLNEAPIGVFGLKNITHDESEYWGFIGEKKYYGLGIGKWIINQSILKAQSLNLTFLYLKVVDINARAIGLYKSMGFVQFDQKENILFMKKQIK